MWYSFIPNSFRRPCSFPQYLVIRKLLLDLRLRHVCFWPGVCPCLGTLASFHSSLSSPFFCLKVLHFPGFFFTICQYLPHSFSFLDNIPLFKCSWQNQYICQHHMSAFVFSSSLFSVSLNTLSSSGQGFQSPFHVCPRAWTSACIAVVIAVIFLWLCLREVYQWKTACLVSGRTNLGDNSAPKSGPVWVTSGKEGGSARISTRVKGNVVLTLMKFD